MSQNLSPVLQNFILNAIAMTSEECPTREALKRIHKLIDSAGRFGNTPFLFALYGTGELPQAFCRLCCIRWHLLSEEKIRVNNCR
jgi:RAB protein geranylgeranyltransferase component A